MRAYLFGSGIISAFTSGLTLLRAIRSGEPFTWRTGLAWASWAISLALAVGSIVDTRRARRGKPISGDSKMAGKEGEQLRKRLRK
jgi:hypothetical protein